MRLEPISALSNERLDELAKLAYVEKVSIGVSLFREGDLDNQTLYLLQGDVQLSSSDGSFDEVVSSRHNTAKFPLDDSQPRQVSCVALGLVEFLRIDNSVLDYMMMWDQLAVQEELLEESQSRQADAQENEHEEANEQTESTESADNTEDNGDTESVTDEDIIESSEETVEKASVEEADQDAAQSSEKMAQPECDQKPDNQTADDSNDQPLETIQPELNESPEKGAWMRRMRHIMAFKNLPPANIKELLEKMESIEVKSGDTIVQQGEPGDSFYVLTDGQARVTRTIELAELGAGASFGEESLVSGGERNASITMKTDGMLMKLSKQDFDQLLKEPMLNRMSPDEARNRAFKGDQWLDVRHASEFHYSHLHKAMNIPLHEIRMRMAELDKDRHYICYCNTGRRSSAAAFILAQAGFGVSVLNGGVRIMPQDLVKG